MGGSIAAAGHASAGCVAGGSAGDGPGGDKATAVPGGGAEAGPGAPGGAAAGPGALGGAAPDDHAARRRAPSAGMPPPTAFAGALWRERQGALLCPAVAGALLPPLLQSLNGLQHSKLWSASFSVFFSTILLVTLN